MIIESGRLESLDETVLLGPGGRQVWRPMIPALALALVLAIASMILMLANTHEDAPAGLAFAAVLTLVTGLVRVLIWRVGVGRRKLVGTSTGLEARVGRARVKQANSWAELEELQVEPGSSFPEWLWSATFLTVRARVAPESEPRTASAVKSKEVKVGTFLVIGKKAVTQVRTLRAYCERQGTPVKLL